MARLAPRDGILRRGPQARTPRDRQAENRRPPPPRQDPVVTGCRVDPLIRRKSAEVLLQLRRPETASALRLALGRDDDPEVRKLAALALTRLGEGAPLVIELLNDPKYQRLAALALAESGDKRGEQILIDWWRAADQREFQQSRDMLGAFALLRARDAVPWLVRSLDDVRLRPFVAKTLAAIGEESARVPLVSLGYGLKQPMAPAALGSGRHDHKMTVYADKNFGVTRMTALCLMSQT